MKFRIKCEIVIYMYMLFFLQRSKTPLVKAHNFMHPDDHLVLEDESGRVKLSGDLISPSVYITGPYLEQLILLF